MSDYRALHDGWTVRAGAGPDGAAPPAGPAPDNAAAGRVPTGPGPADRVPADPSTAGAPPDAPVPAGCVPAGSVPATVPGCVHTDLLAAGLIPDPFIDDNERRLAWIGRLDWNYRTEFDWQDAGAEQVDLVCDGLDTVAAVSLNGIEVGRAQNMHRGHRFPVRHALRTGGNELRIDFTSAYRHIEAMEALVGDRPRAYPDAFNLIRKMACNFGWDWGPSLVTAGIWRPIGLHSWHTARLARVRPLVTVEAGTGVVRVEIDLARGGGEASAVEVTVEILDQRVSNTVPPGHDSTVVELRVRDAPLWWPRGYGGQPLVPLRVTLSLAGEELDRWQRRIGFRSVRLDTTPDAHGTPFTLVVNGRPVMVRGANWIPDDPFPTRLDARRYAHRLDQAVQANINYLRVWGGGRYEDDAFYDAADERGLLVGQDFLFACAAYPEEDPFASQVRAEAEEHVVRLASHPSLVLWTGNNENIWGYHDWGWSEQLAGRSWGAGYYHEVLPGIVSTLDPTRPYWPGSPYSGSTDRHPNEPAHGTCHEWDVWNRIDYSHYRDYVPRFMAEFGFQAPAAYATLRRHVTDDPLAPDSPGLAWHQKAEDGDAKLSRGLGAHLPPPRDFADWHYLTQLNQARAAQTAIEHYRSHEPVCSGAIIWQLNDCWPAISWSAIDSDGRRKPLWYALRRLYADRLLTIQPRDGGLSLIAVNDSDQPWTGTATVVRHRLTGEEVTGYATRLTVPPRATVASPIPTDSAHPDDPATQLLRASFEENRAWWFFAEDRDMAYPAARFAAVTRPAPGGLEVTVTADTIVRDLILYPDRLDPAAEVDDALVTLLPGESATFTVHTGQELDVRALTSAPVLRCVNDLVGDVDRLGWFGTAG